MVFKKHLAVVGILMPSMNHHDLNYPFQVAFQVASNSSMTANFDTSKNVVTMFHNVIHCLQIFQSNLKK